MGLLDIFKKKQQQPDPDRYAGKPFLKIVDSFILKCIGALDGKTEAWLQQLTPKLQETYKHSGNWEEIVIAQLHFEPNIRVAINELWVKNQAIAKQHGTTLDAMEFTEMFVAKNVTDT
jgi:hypothetical protein